MPYTRWGGQVRLIPGDRLGWFDSNVRLADRMAASEARRVARQGCIRFGLDGLVHRGRGRFLS